MRNAYVNMDDLLSTDGFIGKILAVPGDERTFVAHEDGTIIEDTGRPTLVEVKEMIYAFPMNEFGTFDVMGVDPQGNVQVIEGKFIHQIESMLVDSNTFEAA